MNLHYHCYPDLDSRLAYPRPRPRLRSSRPKPRPRLVIKTVLETSRDQDSSLENSKSAVTITTALTDDMRREMKRPVQYFSEKSHHLYQWDFHGELSSYQQSLMHQIYCSKLQHITDIIDYYLLGLLMIKKYNSWLDTN